MVGRVIVGVAIVVAAACSGQEGTVDTVVELPVPATPDTLFPVVTDPGPATSAEAPPDALFGGDLCRALTEGDLRSVAPLVPTDRTDPETLDPDEIPPDSTVVAGEVPSFLALLLADDSCRFELRRPVRFSVVVSARSSADAAGVGSPDGGVDRGASFEVYVESPRGWFSVLAPDEVTARRLATAAGRRV